MIQATKLTTFPINKMIIETTWDPSTLVKDCNESTIIHQLNALGNDPLTDSKNQTLLTRTGISNQCNGQNNPNVQLSISTSKPDHIAELLEATRKMARYFKKSYEHSKTHHSSTDNHHTSKTITTQIVQINKTKILQH